MLTLANAPECPPGCDGLAPVRSADDLAAETADVDDVGVVAMVGFARVYRGLHFLTDVLVGVLLGLACLTVAVVAVRAASRRAARTRTRAAEDGLPVEGGDDTRIDARLSTN